MIAASGARQRRAKEDGWQDDRLRLGAGRPNSLTVLPAEAAFLQCRWIAEVGDAGRERALALLSAAASRIAEEFDRQPVSACIAFLTAPLRWREEGWWGLGLRLRRWRQAAEHPELVRNLFD